MRLRGPSAPDVISDPSAHQVGRTGVGVDLPIPMRYPSPRGSGWVLLAGFGGLAFTTGAVIVEVVSSSYANSTVPGWAHWVPLAWPRPLRATWWLAVAAAAAGFRWSLGRVGLRPTRVATALTVGPFVMFAAGIGVGADWATWH